MQLDPGDIVVFESTFYPGVTEEECVPVLEDASDGVRNRLHGRLFAGANQSGDCDHSLARITKVVSAQDDATLDIVARSTSPWSWRVSIEPHDSGAEAAKIIENTQRDLNIA